MPHPGSFGQSIGVEVPPEVQQQDVTLLPADSAQASKYIAKIVGVDLDRIKYLLPYSVVLINSGDKRLLATAVRFRWTDAEGKTLVRVFAIRDFGGYPSQIYPGEARLFFLQRGLNLYFVRRAAHPEKAEPDALAPWSDLVASTKATLSTAKKISASIDSVVVEGVGLVGPDTAHRRAHGWDTTSNMPSGL